jgi:HAD superfamily hydrolase (TIGR01509 family)
MRRADLAALGLMERFHAVVNSCEVGFAKPGARIYRAALTSAAAAAERALCVDDTPANVAPPLRGFAPATSGVMCHRKPAAEC